MRQLKLNSSFFITFLLSVVSIAFYAQQDDLSKFKPNPEREKMFLPYLAVRHGGEPATENWKKSNTVLYYKELWYYCESFYIKRNYYSSGVPMSESAIDISRYESFRKASEEFIVPLDGFKDALVLLPTSKLLYKP